MLRQLDGSEQESKSAFCAQFVYVFEDPEQSGEVLGLKMAMELLALTKIAKHFSPYSEMTPPPSFFCVRHFVL